MYESFYYIIWGVLLLFIFPPVHKLLCVLYLLCCMNRYLFYFVCVIRLTGSSARLAPSSESMQAKVGNFQRFGPDVNGHLDNVVAWWLGQQFVSRLALVHVRSNTHYFILQMSEACPYISSQ